MNNILEVSLKLLEKYPLCSRCLGRCFALIGDNLTNEQRGDAIKTIIYLNEFIRYSHLDNTNRPSTNVIFLLAKSGFKPAINYLKKTNMGHIEYDTCYLCENIFSEIPIFIQSALEKLNLFEFNSFLVGSKIPKNILVKEDNLKSEFQLEYSESIKREINRTIGKNLQILLGKPVSFSNPDIIITFDFINNNVEISPQSVYIYGRYRKLKRGIPQSKWGRKKIKKNKDYIPKYDISVEELIATPLLSMFEASDGILHAAGREDIDARMLGSGRPFVIELKNPHKRKIPLDVLNDVVNSYGNGAIEVTFIEYTTKDKVRKIKLLGQRTRKVYRALVEVDGVITEELLNEIKKKLNNVMIAQYTPTRVLHRRSEKLRHKKVYKVDVKFINERTFELIVEAQGGLYIKELISGDEGRTSPSIAEIIGMPARCVELDVLDVKMEELKNGPEK
ncbi:MAG: tRNA pseudouridine(54/55) synthase Pus10 [Candidatus Asgardarchaeia archaeon]